MNENFKLNIDTSKYIGISDDKLNYFADLVEIIALISKMEITVGEVLDRFYETNLLTRRDNYEAESSDKNESWIKEIFTLLELRANTYLGNYPFEFVKTTDSITLKTKLSEIHKLYIQLLLSANLPFFDQLEPKLTTDFENISYHSLKSYLSDNPNVKKFGKKTEYAGTNAVGKIKKLAKDIIIEFSEDDLEQVNKYNSNEKGLDVVAWFPFNDNWGNLLVFLGQCACVNKDWHKKRQDAIPYEHFFKFKGIRPIHILFIPHSLTKERGFYSSIHISDTLLFERKRIIDNFDVTNYTMLESNDIVEKVIAYKEDIV